MEAFRIIAGSWPIAVMVLGCIAGGLALYVIRWLKQKDRGYDEYVRQLNRTEN